MATIFCVGEQLSLKTNDSEIRGQTPIIEIGRPPPFYNRRLLSFSRRFPTLA